MNNIEIEKKYLIKKLPELENLKRYYITQAYICTEPVLRIRKKDEKYYFTFKANGFLKRTEIEQEISKREFENILKKVEGNIIKKTRYIYPLHNDLIAEIDIFEKPFENLCIVEVEFASEDEAENFIAPEWFGKEVTKSNEYTNAYMSKINKFSK